MSLLSRRRDALRYYFRGVSVVPAVRDINTGPKGTEGQRDLSATNE